jgi:hypothetical protein
MSCKKSFLAWNGIFDPTLRFGMEDIELSYRLSRRGMKVFYAPGAVQYIHRTLSYNDLCDRAMRLGLSESLLRAIHPDLLAPQESVIKLKREWRSFRATLETIAGRVRALETTLASSERAGSADCIRKLHALYAESFEAFRLKGGLQAMGIEGRMS